MDARSLPPNIQDYMSTKAKFCYSPPDTYNFCSDVIDKWAKDEGKVALIAVDANGENPSHITFFGLKRAANRLALIWEGENGESKFFTYRMLLDAVLRASTLLRSLEFKKGDTLAMFLPNLPETVIFTLACYRLGIIFNTVFSGFSSKALHDRLARFGPSVLITADGALRRGQRLPLKQTVDEALAGHF